MEVLDKLLAHVPQQQINAYNSHLQFHLKQMLTLISKNSLQNVSQIDIRARKCYVLCYRYYMIEPNCDKQTAYSKVEQLRTCKKKCMGELQKVNKYLDDINFYSKQKNESGVKECEDEYTERINKEGLGSVVGEEDKMLDVDYNVCRWKALGRLDRRYRDYWLRKRQKVQQQFRSD